MAGRRGFAAAGRDGEPMEIERTVMAETPARPAFTERDKGTHPC